MTSVSSWAFDRHAELGQAANRPSEPLGASVALRDERRLERLVVGVHPEAEDVQLALPEPDVLRDDGVDLDAGDELEAGAASPRLATISR